MKISLLVLSFLLVSCASTKKIEVASSRVSAERAPAGVSTLFEAIVNVKRALTGRGSDIAGALARARVAQKGDFTVLSVLKKGGTTSPTRHVAFFDLGLVQREFGAGLNLDAKVRFSIGTNAASGPARAEFETLAQYLEAQAKDLGGVTAANGSGSVVFYDRITTQYKQLSPAQAAQAVGDQWIQNKLFATREMTFDLRTLSQKKLQQLIETFSDLPELARRISAEEAF